MLTLRNRLVLVNVLVFLLTFVVLVSVLSGQLLGHLYEQLDKQLERVGDRALERVMVIDGSPRLREADPRLTAELSAAGFVRLIDTKGTVTSGAGEFLDPAVERDALAAPAQGVAFNQRLANGQLLRVFTRPIDVSFGNNDAIRVGYVQTGSAPEEVLETIDQIGRSLLIATPLALLVAGLAALWAARRALKPLTVMTQSAAAISADSLSERRLPIPEANDEVQALALAFNATLDRLAAAFTRQRRFTADASHELRTPVTAILGQAELALNRPRTADAYHSSLVRIQGEAERMQRLIGRLLALARAESGQQILDFAPTDIADLLHTLTATLTPAIEAKSNSLHLHSPDSVVLVTDADSLTQILLNLVENANAYTDAGVIDVTLARRTDKVTIEIADSGPGIDPEDLPNVFEPFFRSDPSRQRQNGSVGLGLALVYELTHLLGGEIEAGNREAGGAVFEVKLPLTPAP